MGGVRIILQPELRESGTQGGSLMLDTLEA